MDTEKRKSVSWADIEDLHQDAEGSPTPTDSMVTVRLSDIQHSSEIHAPTRDSEDEAPADRNTSQNSADDISLEESECFPDFVGNAGLGNEDQEHLIRASEDSTTPMPSVVDEETLASLTRGQRSRSNSSGTQSSTSSGSAHVDWEELEKTEEQAPRDEGSDEVGTLRIAILEWS